MVPVLETMAASWSSLQLLKLCIIAWYLSMLYTFQKCESVVTFRTTIFLCRLSTTLYVLVISNIGPNCH